MRARPTDLQRALEDMAGAIPGLAVDIAVDPDLDLGEDEQVAFIRLAQEAVTNTIRHSYATRLQIDLACEDGQVTLVARDDGVGAHTSELGNGLQGLRERRSEERRVGKECRARRSREDEKKKETEKWSGYGRHE